MEQDQKTFLFCSPAIEELLSFNHLDISELLNQEGAPVENSFGKNPASSTDPGLKDPTTVLLASAAIIFSLTPILSRLLSNMAHKTVVVTEMLLVPVEDSHGKVVRDNNGQPILHWVERAKIIESREKAPDGNQITIQGPLGLKISFDDTKKG